MGKKGKSLRAAKRKQEKHKVKAAKKAQYAAMALESNNSRNKGSWALQAQPGVRHPLGDCGNVGCDRCFTTKTVQPPFGPPYEARLPNITRARRIR